MTIRNLLLLVLTFALNACDVLGVVCTSIAVPGISVTLADSVTNGPPLQGNAVVTAHDGAYADTAAFAIQPSNYNVGVPPAYERAGTYVIQIRVSGYEPWTLSGIRVDEDADGCHVRTRSLTARLRPQTSS